MTAPAMPVTSGGFAPVDEEPSAAAGPPRLRWSVDSRFAQSGVAASVLAAFVVAFTVVNDQSRVFIDATGRSWPFTKLFSNGSTEGWNYLRSLDGIPDSAGVSAHTAQRLLAVHLGLDAGFILCYGVVALLLVRRTTSGRRRQLAGACLAGLLLLDVAEDICAARVVFGGARLTWLGSISLVKWLTAAALLAALLLGRRGVVDHLRNAWSGVRHQRFSLIPVVPLLVLSVLSGHPVLEQLPDAQRGWPQHPLNALAAVAATALAAVWMFLFGRARTAQAANSPAGKEDSRVQVHSLVWVTGPMLLVLLHGLAPKGLGTNWWQLVCFSAAGVTLTSVSLVVDRIRKNPVDEQESQPIPNLVSRRTFTAAQVRWMVGVGDGLAHAIVVIGGLSMLKSFLPLVVLEPSRSVAWAFCVFGLACCLGVWAVPGLLDRMSGRRFSPSPTWLASRTWWLRLVADPRHPLPSHVGPVAALLLGVQYLVWVWAAPSMAVMGMAATATSGLMALTVLVSGLGLLLGAYQTAAPLRWIGLRSTPVVSLLLAASLLNVFSPTSPDLHRVIVADTADPGSAVHRRPSLDEAFHAWAAGGGCTTTVGPTVVKPMLLVSAEGGGIRAAYWTVHALDALHHNLDCSNGSVFASSGASGGSVGLVVAQTAADPDSVVEQMAGPRPLAEGVAALFGADQLTGTTGVPLRTSGSDVWRDRAGSLEEAWNVGAAANGADRWGDQPFLRADTQSTPTGSLILNSTLVGSGCRVWLSQITLDGEAAAAGDIPRHRECGPYAVVAPRTVDLFAEFKPAGHSKRRTPNECVGNLRAVSAAMLTARFPFVTPTGVIGPCGDKPRSQLVDGGYVENSGLRTWLDLAPDLTELIRSHNSEPGAGTAGHPVVVPVVVYLDNGQSLDLSAPTNEVAEPVAPVTAGLAASLDSDSAHVLQLAETFDQRSLCPFGASGCEAAVTALGVQRVVVVRECPGLGLEAPLGWTLSEDSKQALDADLKVQTTGPGCSAMVTASPTSTLAQLRTVLSGPS